MESFDTGLVKNKIETTGDNSNCENPAQEKAISIQNTATVSKFAPRYFILPYESYFKVKS